MYEKGFERAEIIKLFQVIDRMMTLPQELAQSFEERLSNFQEERKVPLLSNMEIRGIEKNARESVIIVLRSRFGGIPDDITNAINNIEDLSLSKLFE